MGDGREAVIGVWITLSIHARTYKASSSGHARKQELFLQTLFGFLARRFLDSAPSMVAAPQGLNISMFNRNDAQTWFDASTCRGWPKRQPGSFCRPRGVGDRAIGVLSTSTILISLNFVIDITCIYHSSPTAVVFYTAENFSTSFAVLPDIRLNFPGKRRRAMPNRVPFSLRTTGFDHTMLISTSPLFHDKFRTLPSKKSPELMTVPSQHSRL